MQLNYSESTPPRHGLTWEQLWDGPDDGLIACWEAGREMARNQPERAAVAQAGELVQLPWSGGLDRTLAAGWKDGTLYYLAMWQGLRGDPLDIDTAAVTTIRCTRYGTAVQFKAGTVSNPDGTSE